EIVVDDDQRCAMHARFDFYFFEFAFADQRGGIDGVAGLHAGAGDGSAGAARELFEFEQRFALDGAISRSIRLAQAEAEKKNALLIFNGVSSFHRRGASEACKVSGGSVGE